MIGSDVAASSEREFPEPDDRTIFQAAVVTKAVGQEFELEFVPVRISRIEVGSALRSRHQRCFRF